MAETPNAESVRFVQCVQCVCGRLKQRGFICDFCYSTEHAARRCSDGC